MVYTILYLSFKQTKMSVLLKLEEVRIFMFCFFLFCRMNVAWWWFSWLLLLPDVGMIGYLINSKTGAFTYNFLHHCLVALLVAIYSLSYGNEYWKLLAIILFAHISLDRALGYSLKYKDGFIKTHLGVIGKK